MNPLVSLNLLLYKPGKFLEPCLGSLLVQTYPELELLIIDNASGDDTVPKVKEFMAGKNINWRLIENEKNLGFAGGHNQGIRESRGELVLLVNQDVILDPQHVEKLVGIFEKDNRTGSAQGKLLRLQEQNGLQKTSVVDSTGLLIFKNRRIIARGSGQKDQGQFDKTEEIFGVDGPLPMYRRAALKETRVCLDGDCEYFDEDFFLYKEDVDLAWRMRLFGWSAFYEPQAVAWHARTAGDEAHKRSYFSIAKERFKLSKSAKYQAFKNQRLLQIKNEQWSLLLKHFIWFLPKEIASWGFVLLFEHYTWKAVKELFEKMPLAFKKRRIIMAGAKVPPQKMSIWFK